MEQAGVVCIYEGIRTPFSTCSRVHTYNEEATEPFTMVTQSLVRGVAILAVF